MNSILCVCLVAAASSGQQVLPTRIYAPARTVKAQGIELKGWGSGTIAETDGIALEGTLSLRVSSRNHFQGGRLIFGEPRDLAPRFEDKGNLLKVAFFLEDAGWIYGQTAINAQKGGEKSDIAVKNMVATAGTRDPRVAALAAIPFKPKIKDIRLLITTTDGKKSEAFVPVKTSEPLGEGWRSISVPLQGITGFERTNKTVQEIAISTDTFATVYIGSIQVSTDTTPLWGEIQGAASNLAVGDTATFAGYGEGGSSVLLLTWDFDDKDGIQVDAEGPQVKRAFRKPGKYVVTLTVADRYGLKQPVRASTTVVVNP